MTPLILFAFVAIALVLVLQSMRPTLQKMRSEPVSPPVQRVPSLLTEAEASFFHILEQAAGGRCRIMCKVRLIDLVNVDKNVSIAWFNKIVPRHVDFLLCNTATFAPLCVVELDDRSHEESSRQEKDKELNLILQVSGIDCARFRASHTYSVTTVKARIEQHLAPVRTSPVEHPDARYMPSSSMV
jgi:hypothetical protein